MQSASAGKTPTLRVRIRGLYVLRSASKSRHTSQSQRPSPAVRGSKTGLVMRRPCVVVPVYVLLCCGRFAAYVGGDFPLTFPDPQRPSEAKVWPQPSALPPLALGKPASPRTVHWLAHCIARWFAQRRARRGNAYSVDYADWVVFVTRGRYAELFRRKCNVVYPHRARMQPDFAGQQWTMNCGKPKKNAVFGTALNPVGGIIGGGGGN